MNKKAVEIGCTNSWFITPNGLDATETVTLPDGQTVTEEHHTTAKELAEIMAYCVLKSSKRDLFREITATQSYSFYENGRNFTCSNHNSFLGMMSGAFSGKTGFTNKAGYCYVGALERDGRTFVVALLACGWPNNKTYKWSDTKKLMEYGLENYTYADFEPEVETGYVIIEDGASGNGNPYMQVSLPVVREGGVLPIHMLVCQGENVEAEYKCKETVNAPVNAGTEVGSITYYFTDKDGQRTELAKEKLFIDTYVQKIDFMYICRFIFKSFFVKKL
jgi:D-alanyl-D-alanine carboxypeptidase (penicillin-binding protein 5/6)